MKKNRKEQQQYEANCLSRFRHLKNRIAEADKYPIQSEERKQTALDISIMLRSFLHDTKNQESALQNLNLKNKIYFLCQYHQIASNMLSDSPLTCFKIETSEHKIIVSSNFDAKEVYLFCGFDLWWNQIVLDYKDKDIKTSLLSRKDIITMIADTEAAHIDQSTYDILEKTNQLKTFAIEDSTGVYYPNTSNIFTEIIISIAKEFIFAFDFSYKKIFSIGNIKATIYLTVYGEEKDTQKYMTMLNEHKDVARDVYRNHSIIEVKIKNLIKIDGMNKQVFSVIDFLI